MADYDADRDAALAHERGQSEPDRFHSKQVDLLRVEPACIVLAEARYHDLGQAFEISGVGDEILARLETYHVPPNEETVFVFLGQIWNPKEAEIEGASAKKRGPLLVIFK